MRRLLLASLVVFLGCDKPRPRFDPDLPFDAGGADGGSASRDGSGPDGQPSGDGGAADASRIGDASDGGSPPDALRFDGGASDAGADDGGPSDAAAASDALRFDGGASDAVVVPDALRSDGGPSDAVVTADALRLDGGPPDAVVAADALRSDDGPLDAAPVADAAIPRAFVVGRAEAADGRTPVTVSSGEARTVTGDGDFRLGPLAPGPATLTFAAPGFQSETVDVRVPAEGEVALPDEVVLYRGRRVAEGAGDRLFFRYDDAWLLWEGGGTFTASPLPEPAPRVLVPQDHEVFLGFAPGGDAAVVRLRNRPGLAGDVELVTLAGDATTPLFQEAQPWVRWLPDGHVLAMVHTRDALSRLQSVVPGQQPVSLAEGVPWLLVTDLADGSVAWAAGDMAPRFGVFHGDAAGDAPDRLDAPDGPAGPTFLTTTPDRRGLLWLGPDAALWRWDAMGTRRVAEHVRAAPRPRVLNDGRVQFWRDDAGNTGRLITTDGANEQVVVEAADPNSEAQIGETIYAVRPGRGLYRGTSDGRGDDVVPGDDADYVLAGDGVVALVDGVAWRDSPERGPERLGVAGLSDLRPAPGGAVAWGPDGSTLWWLPGLGSAGAPAIVVEGGDGRTVLTEPGGAAIYVRVGERYRRVPLPPGPDAVDVDRPLTSVEPEDATRLLGLDADASLWDVDPRTGASTGWARHVDRFSRSPRGRFIAYHCDRGVFVVDLRP